MKLSAALVAFLALLPVSLRAQEMDCDVTFTNIESLTAEARDNLSDFLPQLKQYINTYRWTKADLGQEKIKCAINISFQGSPSGNHYTAQAFIGSQRPIFKLDRSTASVRLLDDKWEFDYTHFQSISHSENRFDPLLSFIDFYVYLIIGYDFDSWRAGDGTPYFQKAADIVNQARGSANAGKGWDVGAQGTYSRGELIDELLSPKFQDFREAAYRYSYFGLDLLYKNEAKARKNMLSALEKIAKLRDKINQQSLVIRIFFDTKYLEIADTFLKDPDASVYAKLAQIDPSHQQTYDSYSQKRRQ